MNYLNKYKNFVLNIIFINILILIKTIKNIVVLILIHQYDSKPFS